MFFFSKDLIEKLSVGVGAKERVPNLRQIVVSHHLQTGLQSVVHFDFALTSQKLDATSTENTRNVIHLI